MSDYPHNTVSVIGTVLNSRDEIGGALTYFLDPVQSNQYEDIVIVDGGSTDGTWEMLLDWSRRFPRLRVFQQCNFNISQSRNYAIRKAKGDIILSFDAGCLYCEDYLTLMITPFLENNETQVVGGHTCPTGETEFERCLASLYEREKQDQTDPSHRAVAYWRFVWEVVGGYPEQVLVAEDTYFNACWRKRGLKYRFVPEAKVFWRVRRSLGELYAMKKRYSYDDVQLRMDLGSYGLIIGFYAVLGAVLVGSLLRSSWSVYVLAAMVAFWFWRRMLRKTRFRTRFSVVNLLRGTAMVLTMDLGTFMGLSSGLLRSLRTRGRGAPAGS